MGDSEAVSSRSVSRPALSLGTASQQQGRADRYNGNFKDAAIALEYEHVWQRELPIYFESNVHAVLGGWYFRWLTMTGTICSMSS